MNRTNYVNLASNVGRYSKFFRPVVENPVSRIAVLILVAYVLIAAFGPHFVSAGPFDTVENEQGNYAIMEPPSSNHPFGTTSRGHSVLSRTVHAFSTSVFVGLVSGLLIVLIGLNLGLVSGYFGGTIDTIVMSFVDLIYGFPLFPIAIVIVAIMGTGLWTIIAVLSLILWRSVARVIRSEVLTLKNQPFVKSAKAVGTSDVKIIYFHILPNLFQLVILYLVLGTIWGVLVEASLSFLGLGDPNSVTWGLMIHRVFNEGLVLDAWWWLAAPSISLTLFIFCLYSISRALEENLERDVDTASNLQ